MTINLISNLLNIFTRDDSFSNQLISVLLRRCLSISYSLIHQRLGKTWLIKLVMTIEAVPDHIAKSVLGVLLPVSNHKLARSNDSLGIASVNSKNRNPERFYNIG
jgi:hypothetical protein